MTINYYSLYDLTTLEHMGRVTCPSGVIDLQVSGTNMGYYEGDYDQFEYKATTSGFVAFSEEERAHFSYTQRSGTPPYEVDLDATDEEIDSYIEDYYEGYVDATEWKIEQYADLRSAKYQKVEDQIDEILKWIENRDDLTSGLQTVVTNWRRVKNTYPKVVGGSTTYTENDIVSAIQSEYTTEQENYIIAGLPDYVTTSGIYTLTSGTQEQVNSWRAENYESMYQRAYKELGYVIYSDSFTTVSGREDLDTYHNLTDEDENSYFEVPVTSGTEYLEMQFPYDVRASHVELTVSGSCSGCFAFSKNGINYTYLGHPNHDVTDVALTLTDYTTLSGATTNYINFSAGTNQFNLPTGNRMKYGRVYFTSTANVTDFDWKQAPRFISRDGNIKMR